MNRPERKAQLNKLSKSKGNVSIDITVSGREEHVNEILEILTYMGYLGSVGHSTDFKVSVDGDGNARINIDSKDKRLESSRKSMKEKINQAGDIKSFGLN